MFILFGLMVFVDVHLLFFCFFLFMIHVFSLCFFFCFIVCLMLVFFLVIFYFCCICCACVFSFDGMLMAMYNFFVFRQTKIVFLVYSMLLMLFYLILFTLCAFVFVFFVCGCCYGLSLDIILDIGIFIA